MKTNGNPLSDTLWNGTGAGAPPRIKVCGLRCPEQALLAARYGADAIGLMLYPPSPRAISLEGASRLAAALEGKASRIGVFVNPAPGWVEKVLSSVALDGLQFHGEEDNGFCHAWGLPWIKAIPVKENMDLVAKTRLWPDASALLFDTSTPQARGGTGQTFDWGIIPGCLSQRFMLAGGLTAANVGEAVRQLRPWAVDVSSGVERARGEKDTLLIRNFIAEVRRAST
ncbi:MAG: phosphoribosylanthranilate isomerase [Kistimonas sp.]|nr:phosphoribosylanthranilate isomerase [Kistimonas sp.]